MSGISGTKAFVDSVNKTYIIPYRNDTVYTSSADIKLSSLDFKSAPTSARFNDIHSHLRIVDSGNNLLADLLGIDPDMMKLIIILIVLVVAYVYLRPIISFFMPNTKPATGGNNTGGNCYDENKGGCDCAI